MHVVELGHEVSSAGLSRLHGRDPAENRKSLSNKEAVISALTAAPGPEQRTTLPARVRDTSAERRTVDQPGQPRFGALLALLTGTTKPPWYTYWSTRRISM
jgi:hypothetical protein